MNIRRITPEDLHQFYALFQEVNAEGEFSLRASPPPIEAVARALLRVQENDWPVYVAQQGGVIVGSAEAYPESFCRQGGDSRVGVLGMQVQRAFRRQGFGAALLAAVEDHCRQSGFSAIELSVLKSNMAARSLYLRAGFGCINCAPGPRRAAQQGGQTDTMRLVL